MELKPDVVILGFTVHNDAQFNENGYRRVLTRKMGERSLMLRVVDSDRYNQVAKYSRIARVLDHGAKWINRDLIDELSASTILANYEDGSRSWETCRNSLIGIYDLCRQNNVPLIVALFPIFKSKTDSTFADYPQDFRNVHTKLKAVFTDKQGVVVIDILDDLVDRGLGIAQLKVRLDGHPNALWHDIVAHRLRDIILNMGL
jgi:hypothetical protein